MQAHFPIGQQANSPRAAGGILAGMGPKIDGRRMRVPPRRDRPPFCRKQSEGDHPLLEPPWRAKMRIERVPLSTAPSPAQRPRPSVFRTQSEANRTSTPDPGRGAESSLQRAPNRRNANLVLCREGFERLASRVALGNLAPLGIVEPARAAKLCAHLPSALDAGLTPRSDH